MNHQRAVDPAGLTEPSNMRRKRTHRLLRLAIVCASVCAFVGATLALALQPAAAQVALKDYPQCISHLWATGSHLGRAEAMARHEAPPRDASMLEAMRTAGQHVERANALCARDPIPWPAWPNWREIQNRLTEMADKFHDGQMNREQLEIALAAISNSLALQLAFRILPDRVDADATCVEIYVRLAGALGFAQTTTRIFQSLKPDAILRLRQSISLIYQMRQMPEPCRDYKELIPAIGEVLSGPNDSSVVERLNAIGRAGEVAAAPRTD